jgi:hypothetical protein
VPARKRRHLRTRRVRRAAALALARAPAHLQCARALTALFSPLRPPLLRARRARARRARARPQDLELSPITGDHNYVKGNSKFFAVAVRGGGGPILVLPYDKVGKLPRGYPLINGHLAPVYDLAWCPANDNILASGSDDCTVKIWLVPEGGLT